MQSRCGVCNVCGLGVCGVGAVCGRGVCGVCGVGVTCSLDAVYVMCVV